jgi:regulator of replication initiation timing
MFGHKKLLDALEALLKRHTWRQNWRLEQLERELKDCRTWLEKVRDKNSALRRDRRHLRSILEANDIPWDRETPGGRTHTSSTSN